MHAAAKKTTVRAMDTEILSRVLFAVTAAFHYIFPPISIGLSLYVLIVEAAWVRTGDERFLRSAKFFLKLFGLVFAVGVATGILMVFQFGTNWPVYSNFVGDVFGSPLAIEAIAAFFLESTFLAVALFGWKRVGKKAHLFATAMVCLGTHLSAVWILAANSFMQTPQGFGIYDVSGESPVRMADGFVPPSAEVGQYAAKIEDFWAMVFSPSFADRFLHTTTAAWLTGGFFALGVCAYFILRRRSLDVFEPSAKIALAYTALACAAMFYTAHMSARGVTRNQPEKMAAAEGHYDTCRNAPFFLLAWVDDKSQTVSGIEIDSMFSLLAYGKSDAKVVGLRDLPSDEFLLAMHPGATPESLAQIRPSYWPPVNLTFQSFHFMVYLGGAMAALIAIAYFLRWKGLLFDVNQAVSRWTWQLMLFSALMPLAASMLGWATAEIGRQPWIVWHILKTKDAVTTAAGSGEILFSLIMFIALFSAVTAVFLVVFLDKLRKGPDAGDERETY